MSVCVRVCVCVGVWERSRVKERRSTLKQRGKLSEWEKECEKERVWERKSVRKKECEKERVKVKNEKQRGSRLEQGNSRSKNWSITRTKSACTIFYHYRVGLILVALIHLTHLVHAVVTPASIFRCKCAERIGTYALWKESRDVRNLPPRTKKTFLSWLSFFVGGYLMCDLLDHIFNMVGGIYLYVISGVYIVYFDYFARRQIYESITQKDAF